MRRLVLRSARPRRCATFGIAALSVLLPLLLLLLVVSSPALAQRSASGRRGASVAPERAPSFAVRGTVSGDDIVRAARRFIGVRYRLGADSPTALDCSSFVRRVFAEYGIALPRTAHEQAGVGEAPPPGGDLRAGDLLFFYGGRGAQHIAIYVGRDSIIHASSRGRRVQLDRLGGAGRRRNWFNERLIAVRRVAPVDGVFRLQGVSAAADSPPPPPTSTVASVAHTTPEAVTVVIPKM